MIVKELEEYSGKNPKEKAGHCAEKDMAFFLEQKYYKDKKVLVFNSLKFEWLDTHTQIDHLLVHPYGLIIIEDKSVTSKIKYNRLGEFGRLWEGKWGPMDNPVKQAERQAENLRNFLNEHKAEILYKILGLKQAGFGNIPIDCIVSVSRNCISIERESEMYDDIVVKADLVTDKIEELMERRRKANRALSLQGIWKFEKDEPEKLTRFLLDNHCPVQKEEALPKKKVAPQKTVEEKIQSLSHCPECKGKVSIEWGAKYKNYYWHCNDCQKNFPINHKCPQCQQKLKVRKQKAEYHIYCEPCNLSALYFEDHT